MVHAVTQACSAGNLTDCSCDLSREGQKTAEGWKWGGCSDDVTYGIWFAETFVDAPETAQMYSNKDIRKLIKLHNNKVGRQVYLFIMFLLCTFSSKATIINNKEMVILDNTFEYYVSL